MRAFFFVTLLAAVQGSSAPAQFDDWSPSLLGRGYMPSLNQTLSLVATPPKLSIKDGASNNTSFGLLATNSDLEKVLQADMSVAANGAAWGAKFKASLTKEHRENRKQITFAATQQVVRGAVTFSSPIELTSAASGLLAQDPAKYVLSYGTSVIESVDLGGSAVFLFTFNFASEEEAMRFAAKAQGRYGSVSGNLNLNIREVLKHSSNNVTVSGFVTGTTEAPNFFGQSGTQDGPRSEFYSAKYSEQMLQNILTYLDGFENIINQSSTEKLSQVSFKHLHISKIPSVNLSNSGTYVFQNAESFSQELNNKLDHIENRRNELQLMTTIYKQFNTDANLHSAKQMDLELLKAAKSLEDFRVALATWGTINKSGAAGITIHPLPEAFCTTQPIDISPRRVPINTGNPQNRPSHPPRKWMEFVVTPVLRNATYTLWADASHGHSRSDPGCNYGSMELRARRHGAGQDIAAPELGSWKGRPNPQPGPEEYIIDSTGDFRVCRNQSDQTFSTKPHSFVAEDTSDARILYSNWDDNYYSYISARVFRCGQTTPN